jgi:hypothetical protein
MSGRAPRPIAHRRQPDRARLVQIVCASLLGGSREAAGLRRSGAILFAGTAYLMIRVIALLHLVVIPGSAVRPK